MGNYNPSAPIVLGEEWVGIRDEILGFTPGVETIEVGHRFTTTASRTLADARFYLNDWPSETADFSVLQAAVYPAGDEGLSGPVQRVIIPCNNGGVSGTSSSIVNATTVADALFSPSDNKYVTGLIGGTGPALSVNAYFAVNNYAQALNGKRILGVNVLYAASTLAHLLPLEDRPTLYIGLRNNAGQSFVYGQGDGNDILGNLTLGTDVTGSTTAHRVSMGTVNVFWSGTLSPNSTPDRMPWSYTDLQRLEASATNRYAVYVAGDTEGDTTVQSAVHYLALEVFYCNETRVAVGARGFGTSGSAYQPWVLNTNVIPLRDMSGGSSPVLPAGDYTVVLSLEDLGEASRTGYPELNALRELATLPVHEGIAIERPFPLDDRAIDKQFEVSTTHVLPQLSLHTSSAPLTEVHVYGRQADAPVYGSVTATQEILDGAAGGANSYPQVRFYARRFGDTTIPLTLDSPSIVGSSVSITPVEFDSLDEVVDGWKEVTLRFTTAPTMGAGTNPQWRFSATGEEAGNQWQVLGMTAPALSGNSSNLNLAVPSGQQLGVATYGAPSAGTTINLGWMYPMVSATTDDSTSDAALLFSTDPAAPTNFAAIVSTQQLSTVDPTCFAAPCVPTALYYNEITWTSITNALAISGFGSYELQRYDPVDGEFSTIMEATSYAVSGFNDYEARVGQPSVYRIRTTNLYDFAGLWSPQVTATITDPGVVGADTALLLFTTNSRQDGSSNLAYSAAWEGSPVEDYVWPESGNVVLQDMFAKDYPTAFRPLERGGERFARQVLVNASGIPPATTQHGFESLRDMAWDTVPYVCVRNEDGDRWYATVIVPGGSVRRMVALGRLCIAAVQVVETTAEPYPVDPS